ncbi:MAG: hypothetical protein KME52_15425 [Desmonostoc geniculatum HA4340-LM1]|jgi:hypothetical protein|nr:hypothetical protein [Desmonostoc geniculatum HA4340-LM1]
MEEDEAFAKQLQALMTQLQANETVKQILLKGVTEFICFGSYSLDTGRKCRNIAFVQKCCEGDRSTFKCKSTGDRFFVRMNYGKRSLSFSSLS